LKFSGHASPVVAVVAFPSAALSAQQQQWQRRDNFEIWPRREIRLCRSHLVPDGLCGPFTSVLCALTLFSWHQYVISKLSQKV
jgi:hypothetical protein